MRFDKIEPIGRSRASLRVVVETPKGSHHKYSYEPEIGFVLRKSLPQGMVFPFDFGFVPKTKGEDGDPIDVLVLADAPLFPGCAVECRLVGVMEAVQHEGRKKVRNDRFIAVAESSLEFAEIKEAVDLPIHFWEELEEFFINYNKIDGKRFQVLQTSGRKVARKQLEKSFTK